MGQKVPLTIKKRVISLGLRENLVILLHMKLEIRYGSVSNIIVQAKRDSVKDRPPENCCSFVEKEQS